MSINIGSYVFQGLYPSTDGLEDRSGVYAILCRSADENRLVDVGESATVKTRVANHDRAPCWKRNCQGTLAFAVYYTPNLQQPARMAIEQEIRKQYDPPCGRQ